MKNKTIGIAAAVVAAVILGWQAWILTRQPAESPAPAPREKITLGAETSLLPAAVWVAENKGFFAEAGVDVTIREFDSGRLSFLTMLAGEQVDISTVAPTPIMFKSMERQDFSILATFVNSYDDVKVIANKGSGIAAAADLKGKKVGTPAGTTGQFFLGSFLVHNQLAAEEVEEVDLSPSELPEALAAGEVDAIVIWEPHAYRAQGLLGDDSVRLPSSEVYNETFNFVAMNDWLARHPAAAAKFLRAIDRATAFIQEDKAAAQDIVAARLGLEKESMSVLWDDFIFNISLDQSLLLTLEDEARWAIRNGLTEATESPNYLDYIYFAGLEAVRPDAITIFR